MIGKLIFSDDKLDGLPGKSSLFEFQSHLFHQFQDHDHYAPIEYSPGQSPITKARQRLL